MQHNVNLSEYLNHIFVPLKCHSGEQNSTQLQQRLDGCVFGRIIVSCSDFHLGSNSFRFHLIVAGWVTNYFVCIMYIVQSCVKYLALNWVGYFNENLSQCYCDSHLDFALAFRHFPLKIKFIMHFDFLWNEKPFYHQYTSRFALPGISSLILLKQSFIACMPLLMATSIFVKKIRC